MLMRGQNSVGMVLILIFAEVLGMFPSLLDTDCSPECEI